MSWSKFDDDCPGCKPAIQNVKTKEVYKDDSPLMLAVIELWNNTTTLEERKAWHDVCCWFPGCGKPPPTEEQKRLAQNLADRIANIAQPFFQAEDRKKPQKRGDVH